MKKHGYVEAGVMNPKCQATFIQPTHATSLITDSCTHLTIIMHVWSTLDDNVPRHDDQDKVSFLIHFPFLAVYFFSNVHLLQDNGDGQ